jgi:ribosomal protein S18 acetylase RimI-like enzyme
MPSSSMTTIASDSPNSPDAIQLVAELETHLSALYPAESRHGFSVARLVSEGVSFFLVRCEGQPAGCVGIHFVDSEYAEIKRMYVRPAFRGRGLGRLLLDHVTSCARERGLGCLRLETGVHQREAIGLYEKMGFRRIRPFGNYKDDPLSRCYEKRIEATPTESRST